MVSPGVYGCHQFTAVKKQQRAYLKNQTRSQIFNCPQTQSFSDPAGRWNPITKRGPYTVQYNGLLPYPNQSGMVENYHKNPPDTETLTHRDTVSEMKRQLPFLDQFLKRIQNSLSELQLVPSATLKSTRQELFVKQRNLWPSDMQGPLINAPLNPSTYLSEPFVIVNETKTTEVQFHAYPKLSLINEKSESQ